MLIAMYVGYWLFCLLVGWGIIQLLGSFGVSWSDGLAPAFLIVFVGMGSVAYLAKRRRLLAEGKPAPPYLATAFPVDLKQTISFPRPLRILVGAIFLLFGVLFTIAAALLFAAIVQKRLLAAVLIAALLGSLGLGVAYVGWRLLVVRDGERLLRPNRKGNK